MTEPKKIQIEFAPGCFDNFDGTQEELDELVAEIRRMAESGELQERSQPVDIDQLIDDDPDMAEALMRMLGDDDEPRNLQ
jgi:hypothetical protein